MKITRTIGNSIVIYKNQNGVIHRTDGPATVYPDGTMYWYQDGKLHRDDGPAEVYPNGTMYWYQNDKLHRLDGPAEVHPNGTTEYQRKICHKYYLLYFSTFYYFLRNISFSGDLVPLDMMYADDIME